MSGVSFHLCHRVGLRRVLIVLFSVAGLPMGAEGPADGAECRVDVHGVEPIQRLEIVKDGRVAWSQDCSALDIAATWLDPVPLGSVHSYYLRVVQLDGQIAWSSPVWVRPLEMS